MILQLVVREPEDIFKSNFTADFAIATKKQIEDMDALVLPDVQIVFRQKDCHV